ncbi:ferredoxin [Falsiruegeria mediterranea]|nr:ferredoxin [Falsiruegeria mediterranea]
MAGRSTRAPEMEPDAPVSTQVSYAKVEAAARATGLIVMGAQHPRMSKAKQLNGGTLILLGTAAAFWDTFETSPEWTDGLRHPIDRWSTRVVQGLAQDFTATAYFPFGGPPYTPFIDWALKSGRTFTSPVGALVQDTVGMLISFRGALHFEQEFDIPQPSGVSPCTDCPAPCATACPVEALNAQSFYDVDNCHAYLNTPAGQTCLTEGCATRLACPVSAGAGRSQAQTAHHMRAFHPS